MSNNSCRSNKNAFIARCRKTLATLSSGTFFYVEDGRGQGKITWGFLQSLIQATVLNVAIIPKRVYKSTDYMADGTEDEIYCTGAIAVTLPEVSENVKSPVINASNGTVTVVPSGADSIQAGFTVIVDGDSGRYGPKVSTKEWRAI